MEDIRKEKLLEGNTRDGLRTELRDAVVTRNPVVIAGAMGRFTKAEIPDDHGDLEKANK